MEKLKIDEEKRKWLLENMELIQLPKEPVDFFIVIHESVYFYSRAYIENTPLSKLKELYKRNNET